MYDESCQVMSVCQSASFRVGETLLSIQFGIGVLVAQELRHVCCLLGISLLFNW